MAEPFTIPGYRVDNEIGKGGMASVYLGYHEKLKRQVAIKVLSPLLQLDDDFVQRFIQEAQTAASLVHPNIVTVFDVGQTDQRNYIIMEYLSSSLKAKIMAQDLSIPQTLSVLKQMAAALDYASRKGFVHRDIKPDNIMFREDGTAVLTDFGIARAMDAATNLTKTGTSIGTPHYMSPEQVRGKPVDGRSDLYTMGIVFYEMLTGKVPYTASDLVAIAIMHVQEPVPKLPASLAAYQYLLDKLMAKESGQRFQSGAELRSAIDGFSTGVNYMAFQAPNHDVSAKTGLSSRPGQSTAELNTLRNQRTVVMHASLSPSKTVKKRTSQARNWMIGCVAVLTVFLVVIFVDQQRRSGLAPSRNLQSTQPAVTHLRQSNQSDLKNTPAPPAKIDVARLHIEMKAIPGGTFQMGSVAYATAKPIHAVSLAPFFMGKTEVTQGQWQAVMGFNRSRFKLGDNYPVENVSWHDCQEFIRRLNSQTGSHYRLPTEAEWEYACRAGTSQERYGDLDAIAWCSNNAGSGTNPVGQKQPNAYGLYDMLGNVLEWCQDWFADDYYAVSPAVNPTGPPTGIYRVFRGGGWRSDGRIVRVDLRNRYEPGDRLGDLGLRLAANE